MSVDTCTYKWKGWRRKSGHAEIFFRAFPLWVRRDVSARIIRTCAKHSKMLATIMTGFMLDDKVLRGG